MKHTIKVVVDLPEEMSYEQYAKYLDLVQEIGKQPVSQQAPAHRGPGRPPAKKRGRPFGSKNKH